MSSIPGKVRIVTILALFIFSLFLISTEVNAAPDERDAMSHFFDASFNNLAEELSQAKSEGKQGILIMFSDPDCPWCMKMKSTILNQPTVQDYYRQHFRLLHIDTKGDSPVIDFSGKEMSEKDFSFKVHRVRATPVFMIFDLQGKDVLRYTGTARNTSEFNMLGEFIVSGEYQKTNFTTFKHNRLSTIQQAK